MKRIEALSGSIGDISSIGMKKVTSPSVLMTGN